MIVVEWLAAILASIVGGVAVALVGWFYGLRQLRKRVEDLERKQAAMDEFFGSLVQTIPDEQAGKVLKIAWRDRGVIR